MFGRWKKPNTRKADQNGSYHNKRTGPIPGQFHESKYEVVASLRTDVGCQRELNEDSGLYIRPEDSTLLTTKGWLAIVADGMGGHAAGEVASNLAVDVIRRIYYEDYSDAYTALRKAFLEANRQIYESSLTDENLKGMGTTCTALALQNGSAVYIHVGDSRLYMVRGGDIYLMTQDHSAVMEMVKHGVISIDEARHHPDKNIILRALGNRPEIELAVGQKPFPAREGDCFILCSDGLYDLVEDQEIKRVVLAEDPNSACETLIAMAKQRGGHDNITVAIISLKPIGFEASRQVRITRELEVIK